MPRTQPDDAGISQPPAAPAEAPPLDTRAEVPAPREVTDLVRARWVGAPVFNPEQGLVDYGGEIYVTAEQLADGATPAIEWRETWQPDPVMVEMFAAPEEDAE